MTHWKQSLHRKSSELKEDRPDEHWLRCNETTRRSTLLLCPTQRCHPYYVTVQRRDYLSRPRLAFLAWPHRLPAFNLFAVRNLIRALER